jgi:hypothetical protein
MQNRRDPGGCVKKLRIASCIAVLTCSNFGEGLRPTKGFVPDSQTASRIAEAVLIPIYGKAAASERPFKAELKEGIWTVTGTRHCQENLPGPIYCTGGHSVRLSKDNGRILYVSHEK